MANEWYQNNINNMRGYQNINKTGTQAWPEYNENLFKGIGGRFDIRNMMRPSNLSQDMGASNYQAPPPAPVYPGQRNIHEGFGTADVSSSFPPPEKTGFNLPNFMSPVSEGIGWLKEKFKDNPEEAFGRNYFNLTDTGRIAGSPATDLYSGTNVSSMFGKGADAAGQKRIDRIQGTLDKWESDEEKYAKQLKNTTLYDRLKEFKKQQSAYQRDLNLQTGQGGTKVIPPGVTSQGDQVNTGGGQRDTSGWDSPGYSTRGGFAPRQTAASQHAGAGASTGRRGHHSWAEGGRIGYRGGELVDEDINVQGPGFDVNENIEMAEGKMPFDLRIEELMEKHNMSYEDAYDIAEMEFQDLFAEGQEDSFGDQGLASLV